jgi:DNA-binding transcriptional LysR family regulator
MSLELTFDQVDAFCAVCDAQSFPAAAKLPGRERTSLHHYVDRLERIVGERLLVRSDPVALTPTGNVILPRARRVLEACQALLDTRSPTVRFTAYPSHIRQVATSIGQFASENPEIEVEYHNISDDLRFGEGAHLIARLGLGEFDLTIAPKGLKSDGIEETPLYEWSIRVVLPTLEAFEGLRAADEVRLNDLRGLRALVAPPGHMSRRIFDRENENHRPPIEVAFDTAQTEVLVDVARASRDLVAIVPEDAFGRNEPNIGPRFVRKRGGRALGGAYSLYGRIQVDAENPTPKERAVEEISRVVLAELGNSDRNSIVESAD